jgi:glutamine synthetase
MALASRPVTADELKEAGVRAVALVLVDNAGIARMKCVPIDRLDRAAEQGVGWSDVWGLVLASDTYAHVPGLYSPTGELRVHADLASARPIGAAPGWGFAPVDHRLQSGEPWAGCQRIFLRRMVAAAADRGLELQAAWELEWTVGYESDEGFEPLHRGPGYGAATFDQTGDFLMGVFDGLAESGIQAEQVHPEFADGQMEVSLAVRDPVTACDEELLSRHVIRSVAGNEGWRASFSPRVMAGAVGNGAHLHVSVWREGVNQMAGGDGPEGMRAPGASFLAGVLAHLPGLTAIAAPSALSYARLVPSHWAGAYVCWGNENREAALRVEGALGPSAPRSAHFEWKTVDGAANPYLALGVLIAAGLDGVERGLELPAPVSDDPAEMPASSRPARLPQTLAEAAEALAACGVLRAALGDYLHDRVVAVRLAEVESAHGLEEAVLVEKYRWRW